MTPAFSSAQVSASAQDSVLVIDDDPREIRLLSEMLRPEGYRLFAALSGEEGFKRALEQPPGLVLLDLNMPGLDGQDTCRLFKGAPRLSAIPVIFLTGSGLLDDKLRAFSHGAVDYITKPFSAQEVIARLRVHFRLRDRGAERQRVVQATGTPATDVAGDKDAAPLAAFYDPGERMVRQAQAILLRDLRTLVTLADLARTVGTNERRLTEEFRRYTGMAVFEYLRQERYRAACELLLHSEMSVSMIAAAVGFNSVAAFSFAFRKYCGLTPSQYRQSAGLGATVDPEA